MEETSTLYVGNLSDKVTEEILFELFLQAGPVKTVCIPKDNKSGRQRNFGFVTFKHDVSVQYSIDLMNGIKLFNMHLNLNKKKSRNGAESPQPMNDERNLGPPRDLRMHVMNEQMMNNSSMMPTHFQPMHAVYYQQSPVMDPSWLGREYPMDDRYNQRQNHTPRQRSYNDRDHRDAEEYYTPDGQNRRNRHRNMNRSVSGPSSSNDKDYRKHPYRRR